MLIASTVDIRDIRAAEKVFDAAKVPYDSTQIGNKWFLSTDQPVKARKVLLESGLVKVRNPLPSYYNSYDKESLSKEIMSQENELERMRKQLKRGTVGDSSYRKSAEYWARSSDIKKKRSNISEMKVLLRKKKNPLLETIIAGVAGGAGLAAGFVGTKKLIEKKWGKNPVSSGTRWYWLRISKMVNEWDKIKSPFAKDSSENIRKQTFSADKESDYKRIYYTSLNLDNIVKKNGWNKAGPMNLKDFKSVKADEWPDAESNPLVNVSKEAVIALARMRDDSKAGHDAEDYWRGAAGAYFTANPTSKVHMLSESGKSIYCTGRTAGMWIVCTRKPEKVTCLACKRKMYNSGIYDKIN